jgi:hypothetical protein
MQGMEPHGTLGYVYFTRVSKGEMASLRLNR